MSDRLVTSTTFSAAPRDAWRHRMVAFYRTVHAVWRRHATRHRIADLDAHALKDIGVSYAEAEAEANKPFWRG